MSAVWPSRRHEMLGLRVRVKRQICNHDGPVKVGTAGKIIATFSLQTFTIQVDECSCCGFWRRVTYVTPADVELVA